MPRAPAMPACLAPGDVRMPRALAMPHASRSGDARMPHAMAMPDYTSPRLAEGESFIKMDFGSINFGLSSSQCSCRFESILIWYPIYFTHKNDSDWVDPPLIFAKLSGRTFDNQVEPILGFVSQVGPFVEIVDPRVGLILGFGQDGPFVETVDG
ncbi:hypothetical protein VNO80_19365 [Phaseolus coccineus]|uniref:Uncharacterized protein n=1 Tax=Phaseolus coccineus TaxID=3886 RepID=A0AAN9MFZ8_PHACN